MRKIIIASSHVSKNYQKSLLKNKDVAFGVHVLPFDAYFFNTSLNEDASLLLAYNTLNSESFENLSKLFKFPKTIQELINFIKELNTYNISTDNLPLNTSYDADIQKALKLLNNPIKNLALEDKKSLRYIPQGLTHAQIHYLEANDIQPLVDESWTTTPTSVEFYTALNPRREIEGMVQYLLRNDIEGATVLVPDLNTYIPYIKAAFNRYNIPYEKKHLGQNTSIHQFISLLDYYLEPSTQSVLNIIESNVLNLSKPLHIIEYINYYKLTHKDLLKPFNYAQDDLQHLGVQELYEIQEDTKNDVFLLQETMNTLSTLGLRDALIYSLELVRNYNPIEVDSIQTYLQNTLKYIDTSNIDVVKRALSNLNTTNLKTDFIVLSDYNNLPLEPVEHLIVLGLSAKNFPGLSAHTGILDTSYRKRVSSFPTQDILNQFQLNQKEMIFNKSNHLVLSIHETNIEGKAQEISNRVLDELRKQDTSWKPWLINEDDPYEDNHKSLHPEVAKELYLKDIEGSYYIKGSVSSFEKYIKDPYEYFLDKGLKVKKPFDLDIFARFAGTLNHRILENFESIEDNEDSDYSIDTIQKEYSIALPKNDAYLSYFFERNKKLLLEHIDHLNTIQSFNSFKPYKNELYIQNRTLFDQISFSGFVDRIDRFENKYMIIDYKSSDHKLTEGSLEKGERLQLVSYAIALQEELRETDSDAEVFGVYYYSFNEKKAKSNNTKFIKYAKTKGITYVDDIYDIDYEKMFELQGWTFGDKEGVKFPDFAINKTSFNTKYFIKGVELFVKDMYAHLKDKILAGVLEKDDLELPLKIEYTIKEKK